jgi:uncharacterized protein YjiS (DUF1127 family)
MACASGACSYPLDLSRFSGPAPAHPPHRIRPGRWALAIIAMHERWRQRQRLSELDDRMLADIGLTRDEARAEVTKPFWK